MKEADPRIVVHLDGARVAGVRTLPTTKKRGGPWIDKGGCSERFDLDTGGRIAFVNPEPGAPAWLAEAIAPTGEIEWGERFEPDTIDAAKAWADDLLRSAGYELA